MHFNIGRVYSYLSDTLAGSKQPTQQKPRVEQLRTQERSESREVARGRSERTGCYTPCDLLSCRSQQQTHSTMQSTLTRQVNKASAGVRSAPRVAKARRVWGPAAGWGGCCWGQGEQDRCWMEEPAALNACTWHRSDVVSGYCRCPASPWCAVLTASSAQQPTWCVPHRAGAADVEFSACTTSAAQPASPAEQLLAEATGGTAQRGSCTLHTDQLTECQHQQH